jgi:hypothetical protein
MLIGHTLISLTYSVTLLACAETVKLKGLKLFARTLRVSSYQVLS